MSDDEWDDDEDGGDDGDWGDDDLVDPDEFMAGGAPAASSDVEMRDATKPEEEQWKCTECEAMNRGMMCLNCGEINYAEQDRQIAIDQELSVRFYSDIYTKVHMPLRNFRERITDSLEKGDAVNALRDIYEKESIERLQTNLLNPSTWAPPHESGQCQICFCEFSEDEKDEDAKVMRMPCHGIACRGCFRTYVVTRLMDDDIIPHIPCPDEECTLPMTFDALMGCGLSVEQVYRYVDTYCKKKLARNQFWVFCPTARCGYGWAVIGAGGDGEQKECDCCGETNEVKRKMPMDEGFKQMLKEGKIRRCPACKHPHMKDKGICNVMQCIQCNIWWNWNTLETGNSQRELKQKARQQGTLWEPGELQWQQELEKSDPEAFRQLLERNGITYDPNYVRGS